MQAILKGAESPAVYRQLRQVLFGKISSGELNPGDRISPELILADTFKVSRTTIRRALSGLVRDGLIVRFPGKGTFINHTSVPGRDQLQIGMDFFANFTSNGFYGAIAQGILDEARENEVSVFLLQPEEYDPDLSDRLNGYLFIHSPPMDTRLFQEISKGIIPAVGLNHYINKTVGFLEINNFAEAQKGTEFLLSRGHRNIAFYGNSPGSPASAARYAGWRSALQTDGQIIREANIHFYDPSLSAFAQAEEFFRTLDATALFVSTAPLLSMVLAVMNRLKIAMPDDLQILCFDDLSSIGLDWPGIAYIKMPLYKIGRRMLETLRQKIILGERAPEIQESFAAEIVYKEAM
ncbi:MAG: GntR family transcriptional regulator [Lentisphaeria bacterium]